MHEKKLLAFIESGDIDAIKTLIDENIDYATLVLDEQRPLIHYAAERGYLDLIQFLLEKNPKLLNLTDRNNQTPILWAAAKGHEDIVEYLAKLGAHLTLATTKDESVYNGYAPIHWASEHGHHTIIQCLITQGADINMQVGEMQYYPIHIAARKGHLDAVKLLLDKNPGHLNVIDIYGQTPLLWAAAKGYEDVVEYLSKLGANLTLATNCPGDVEHGKSAIHNATEEGYHKVLQCLIEHGADTEVRVGDEQLHLIHIAAINGHLDVVKLLLDKDPEHLNLIDKYGQTPLLWAAAKGYEDIVEYLAKLGAHLTLATNRPGHADDGKTPLTWALDAAHNDAASYLILKTITHQNQNAIVSLIQTADLALELMTLEPAMVDILWKNKRIAELIHNQNNCHIKEKSIAWYKTAGRRPSWFVNIDKETGSSSVFKPVRKLGKGGYGIVRLFQNTDGQEVAIKSLKNNAIDIPSNKRHDLSSEVIKEAEFNKRAYPGNLSEIFDFNYKKSNHQIYTNRYVMPYISGETARKLMPTISCSHQLANIILQIARELQQIHEVGIIHADVQSQNIMIHCKEIKPMVRFVDFGLSSYMTERTACTFKNWDPEIWMAPEICCGKEVKPHASQDVYSLGFTLNTLLNKHSSHQKLMLSFPSISAFITTSQNINPMERPSLESFCQELDYELNIQPKIDVFLNSDNPVLETIDCQTIETLRPTDAQQKTSFTQLREELTFTAKQDPSLSTERQKALLNLLLTQNTTLMTWKFESNKILSNFLSYALFYNKPEIVTRLMTHEQWSQWSQFKSSEGYTLLHLMAWMGAIEACQHLLPLIDINEASNPKQFTALHLATRTGHAATCQFLLEHGADPTLKNKEGKTADELGPKEDLILAAKQAPNLSKEKQEEILTLVLTQNAKLVTWEFESNKVLSSFLSYALFYNKPEIVTRLITHEQWPQWSQFKSSEGYTLLHLMAWMSAIEACQHLLPLIDINEASNPKQFTALHLAARTGHAATCQFLLEHGADPTLKNKKGKTAIKLWPDDKEEENPFTRLKENLICLAKQDPRLSEERQKELLALVLTQNPNLITWKFAPTERLSHFLVYALEYNKRDVVTQLAKHEQWPIYRAKHLEQTKFRILKVLNAENQHGLVSHALQFFTGSNALDDLTVMIRQAKLSPSTPLEQTAIDILNNIFDTWQHTNPKVQASSQHTPFSLGNLSPKPIEKVWQAITVIINPELALPQPEAVLPSYAASSLSHS